MPLRSTAVSFCSVALGFRPLDGDLRVAVAIVFDDGVAMVLRGDVLEILILIGGVDAEEVVILGHLVHQDVVHKTAVLVEQARVVRLADLQFWHGVGSNGIGEFGGLGPANLDLAHVADIENADPLRTALCSSRIPEYCTGMSHPPKSTILAPRARWTEFKGVTRRAGDAGMKTQANSTGWGCQFTDRRPAQ
jgi:hypothetical protein